MAAATVKPGSTYTGAWLKKNGYAGVVGSLPDNAKFLALSSGGWTVVDQGTGSGGGTTPPAPPSTSTPAGGGAAGGGAGGASMSGLMEAASMSTGGGDGSGAGTEGAGSLLGPSKFRQGIGNRVYPQMTPAMLGLKQVY